MNQLEHDNRQNYRDDPVGRKVSWDPSVPGGTNFCTHTLREVSPARYEFKATYKALIFATIFTTIGLAALGGLVYTLTIGGAANGPPAPVLALFALLFTGAGGVMMRSFLKTIVFDKGAGYFWKGGSGPRLQGGGIDDGGVRIQDIYAIQVLAEVCVSHNKNRTTRYNSYELNLVLAGGSRVNVIDHGNREQILEDARNLASFLGVPLWIKG